MMDLGFDKLALIGAVALIVIGPEKLPRVARTVGHLLGKAQRYVSDVKAEVNRSIELDELKKMKTEFETAARDVEQSVGAELRQTSGDLEKSWSEATNSYDGVGAPADDRSEPLQLPPAYRPPKKNWRLKRGATPQWYKRRQGIRTKALSGAARVSRFRPPRPLP
jgi:sec-independent protein translocase protein TatB